MARAKTKRENLIAIRLTDKEKLDWELKAHAAGVSLSKLVRESMERVRVWNVKDRKLEQEKIRQIARIGNNLNQLARWANTYKGSLDTIEIVTNLKAIREELKQLKIPTKTQEKQSIDAD